MAARVCVCVCVCGVYVGLGGRAEAAGKQASHTKKGAKGYLRSKSQSTEEMTDDVRGGMVQD